jgi:sec-independent protein translocase protein TatB
MEFLGIGPLEFLLIIVIAVIVLGPKGMVKAAREIGLLIRKVVKSPLWRDVMDTSREIRDIPQKIVREAGIEEDLQELRRTTQGTIAEIQKPAFTELSKPQKPAEKSTTVPENQDMNDGNEGEKK